MNPVLLKVGLIVTTAIVAVAAVRTLVVDEPVPMVPLKERLIHSIPLFLFVVINVVVHEVFHRSTGPLWDFGGMAVVLIAMLIIWRVRRRKAR